MGDDLILLRGDNHTATLLINRPHKRNALSVAMWQAIPGLLAQVANDSAVRLVFVRGAGGVFAAGADIAEMPSVYATAEAAQRNDDAIQGAMAAIEDFPKPVVALIEGACVGGGCGIALACDIRIAAHGARLGITPAKLGLVYGAADARRLVQAVGLSRAKDILFTGRLLGADEALAVGLVDRSVPPEALEAEAAALAAQITANSGWSHRAQKEVLALLRGGADGAQRSRELFGQSFGGADFAEGFAAFTQKRPPRF
jgi:enoyl-CoA hydratase/carnithine racemase